MQFSLVLDISREVNTDVMLSLSSAMKNYFSNKNYGDGVKSFLIGIICVNPVFDQFAKPRRPKYIGEKTRETHDDITVEYEKVFSYEIKLDFTEVTQASNEEVIEILKREILDSLSLIDKPKISNFDKEAFKQDVREYLS